MGEIRCEDFYDPWGMAMGWLFSLADVMLYFHDHVAPGYVPPPIPITREALEGCHSSAILAVEVEAGNVTLADLGAAYKVMSRYTDWCKLAGRNY